MSESVLIHGLEKRRDLNFLKGSLLSVEGREGRLGVSIDEHAVREQVFVKSENLSHLPHNPMQILRASPETFARVIELAPPYSTVSLQPGRYEVNLIIHTPITLRGGAADPEDVVFCTQNTNIPCIVTQTPGRVSLENLKVISTESHANASYVQGRINGTVTVLGGGVEIRNCVICFNRHPDSGSPGPYATPAVHVQHDAHSDDPCSVKAMGKVLLQDCKLKGGLLAFRADVWGERVEVTGAAEHAVRGPAGGSIELVYSDVFGNERGGVVCENGKVRLTNCRFSQNGVGVLLSEMGEGATDLKVVDCRITSHRHLGIGLLDTHKSATLA
uniref:Right handed beta helix domain-containing protein n=1 Tax=Chromera velia CCMP2878 TaxID=1169474 RepID=A0A0G4HC18_9ALVE|eukprot:Cvel_26086.t1-p1 / transcript=Cvel_26086.t1 / gene=Cvel_26086 / organism=Chromera_velia_CCMP2878 / gene_product=hypothetical protein / transcript_product=hypothetical protein / location=Cvel_scaffold3047:7812-8798(-) / protein_length=329 / sequence_SO=supercontig / SO=protein_coding / is_pseudo=false